MWLYQSLSYKWRKQHLNSEKTTHLAADELIVPVWCFCFLVIQTGGKERTTEEWGFSPPTLSQPIWTLSQNQVGLSAESQSEHCSGLPDLGFVPL